MNIRAIPEDLEARIDYLEDIHRFTVDALEMAASLGDFQSSINGLHEPSAILRETGIRVRRLIPFQATFFYLVDEDSSDFRLANGEPESARESLTKEIEFLIDNGTFAWALRENRAIRVSTRDFEKQMILHVMATCSRIRGLFVGMLPTDEKNISEVSLSLLSIILLNSANALESFELYKMVQEARTELEGRVKERTLKLGEANEKLQLEIAEHKQTEGALRESEEVYRKLVATVPDIVVRTDINGRIVFINDVGVRLSGHSSADQFIGKTMLSFIAPEDLPRAMENSRLMIEHPLGPKEYSFVLKNGVHIQFEVNGDVLRTPDNEPYGMVFVCRDITKRRRTEKALTVSEERLRLALEAANEGLWDWDIRTGEAYFSPRYYTMLGYAPGEFPGSYESWENLLYPPDLLASRQAVADYFATRREDLAIEFRALAKSGEVRWILSRGKVVEREEQGNPIRIVGTHTDITKRKEAEAALKESEERHRLLVENSHELVAEVDPDLRFLYASPNHQVSTGYHPAELTGTKFTDFVHPEDLPQLLPKLRASETEAVFRYRHKEGSWHWLDSRGRWFHTSTGEMRGVIFSREITNLKESEERMNALQEQLRQSQKMEAIGQLAGGIAHDFNNILTVIGGRCQLALFKLAEGESLRGNIEEIKKASDRAASLTQQLLAFSRRQILEFKVVDLKAVLLDLKQMLRRVIGEDIELVTILKEGLWKVKTDRGQIEQVILNLAVNARDAMPNGGKLILETANIDLDDQYARSHAGVKPGPYVSLSVSDTGMGMTPEVREHIFEPFFTTKEKGKGTGLGLSTVYGIVKQSRGNIWVYSESGYGTVFKIYLPRVDEPAEVWGERIEGKEAPRGTETILLVEDEADVRKLTAEFLREQGYKVLEAPRSGEAFSICRQHREPIDLMVTDVVMPGMNGRDLAGHLLPLKPEMKVLYMSGYTNDTIVHHGILEEGVNFIQKPFVLVGLAKKIRDVLERDPESTA